MSALSPPGLLFLLAITFLVPVVAIRATRRVRQPGGIPTRARYRFSFLFTQGMMLFLALATARVEWIDLFPPPHFDWNSLIMAIAFLVPSLGTLPARWGWRSIEEKRQMLWRMPSRASDLGWWLFVSLVAGVGEEIVYRGVLLQLWERLLGSWWPAVLMCAAAFALAHFIQGMRAVLVIFFLAIANHIIVRACGDLYTAMIIHFLYDLLAGVIILLLARREGIQPAQNVDPVSPLPANPTTPA